MKEKTRGFVISSPILALNEGTRTIQLCINLYSNTEDTAIFDIDPIDMNHCVQNSLYIDASGDEDWICLRDITCTFTPDRNLEITIVIGADIAPIVNYKNTLPGDIFNVTQPLLKLSLENDHQNFSYKLFRLLKISSVMIGVEVKGLNNLELYNSGGKIDGTKPFQLFGPMPVLGSYLSVSHQEIAKGEIDDIVYKEIGFNIEWFALPPEGFAQYYVGYQTPDGLVTNNSFMVNIIQSGVGVLRAQFPNKRGPNADDFILFNSQETSQNQAQALLPCSRFICYPAKNESNSGTNQGSCFAITISGPPGGFLSEQYVKLMTNVMLENEQKLIAKSKQLNPIPNVPFVPVAKSISIDYKATQSLNANDTFGANSLHFF